jgi:hypothetical protein
MTGVAFMQLALIVEEHKFADQAGLLLCTSVLVYYIVTGKIAFMPISEWLVRLTPLGVLYRNDKQVLYAAKVQLQVLAGQVKFSDLQSYQRINPYINAQDCSAITSRHSKGELAQWLGDVKNLKGMSDLVYQLWVVEKSIAHGDYDRP